MAFIDKKKDDYGTEDELDPIDEILKRINENRIDLPEQEDKEPAPEKKEETLPLYAEPEGSDESEDSDEPVGSDGETVIEEPAEEDELLEEEPVDENERCVRCGKRRRDTSVSPDYEYCKKCREDMRYAPLRWQGIVCALCLIIITGAAVSVASASARIASPVMDAKNYEADKRYSDALAAYGKADDAAKAANTGYKNDVYSIGTKTFVAKMKMTAKVESPLKAGNMLSQSPVKDAVNYKSPWQKSLKKYSDMYAVFDATQTAVEPILSPYQSTKAADIPYNKLISQLNALETGKDAKKYAAYIIEYYKAMVASLADKGPEAELKFIQQVKKQAPDETWLYNPYLASCYQRLNDNDTVISLCNAMIAENRNDIKAYSMKARALCNKKDTTAAVEMLKDIDKYNAASSEVYALKVEVNRRSGDITEALKLCEKAVKDKMASAEFYRQQAIVYLLKDDKQAAYEAASNVYNALQYSTEGPTLEQVNTIALCAYLNKDMEMYKQIVKSLTDNGYKLADSVDKCIKGKMTVKEIFVTGKGDVL